LGRGKESRNHGNLLRTNSDEVHANWDVLMACGDLILKATGLPGFVPEEKRKAERYRDSQGDVATNGPLSRAE
jgi:hypothetical protein